MKTVLAILPLLAAVDVTFAALPVCDVVASCGADPTNRTDSTAAIQKCIDNCNQGGIVAFPANGHFLTGSLNLSSTTNVIMDFGSGSHLHAIPQQGLYPIEPALPATGNPKDLQYRAMLAGSNVVNLTLRGPTDAVIDGQGWPWWANFSAGTLAYQRPKLLEISDCNGLTVEGLTIQNSPFWTTHPIFCNDVTFRGVTVLAPRPVGNTDGIDPNSCSNVLIDSCHIDVGDDGISVKSGFREDGTLVPTANVLIRNTTVLSRNVAIGSACFGGIFNVTMVGGRIGDDGNADGIGSAPWAVKIKTHHPNGGIVRNITFDSVRFGRITPNPWQQAHGGYAINIMEEYGAVHPFVATPAIPHTALEDITFRNISCPYAVIPATFDGESDALITRLTLDNVQFATTTRPWGCSDMTQTVANNVQPPLPSSCGQN